MNNLYMSVLFPREVISLGKSNNSWSYLSRREGHSNCWLLLIVAGLLQDCSTVKTTHIWLLLCIQNTQSTNCTNGQSKELESKSLIAVTVISRFVFNATSRLIWCKTWIESRLILNMIRMLVWDFIHCHHILIPLVLTWSRSLESSTIVYV